MGLAGRRRSGRWCHRCRHSEDRTESGNGVTMRELRLEHEGRGKGFRLVIDPLVGAPLVLAEGLGAAEVLAFISQAAGELRRWGAAGVEGVASELTRVLKLVGGRRI